MQRPGVAGCSIVLAGALALAACSSDAPDGDSSPIEDTQAGSADPVEDVPAAETTTEPSEPEPAAGSPEIWVEQITNTLSEATGAPVSSSGSFSFTSDDGHEATVSFEWHEPVTVPGAKLREVCQQGGPSFTILEPDVETYSVVALTGLAEYPDVAGFTWPVEYGIRLDVMGAGLGNSCYFSSNEKAELIVPNYGDGVPTSFEAYAFRAHGSPSPNHPDGAAPPADWHEPVYVTYDPNPVEVSYLCDAGGAASDEGEGCTLGAGAGE